MEDLINFSDPDEKSVDVHSRSVEVSDFPQTLVTEKIIFVIDVLLLVNDTENKINTIPSLCKSYLNVKKKICVKPAKFECLLYNNYSVLHSYVENSKDIHSAFLKIQTMEPDEETEPLKIDKVFNKIASLVELPDSESSRKGLPPNWVYHVVWLFSRNLHIPTMEDTNSFDYLMMTPYFALDILYVYDRSLESNECESIAQALMNLNENGKGYLLQSSVGEPGKLLPCIAQFLGHPLMRMPQVKAKFNILELGRERCYNDNEQK